MIRTMTMSFAISRRRCPSMAPPLFMTPNRRLTAGNQRTYAASPSSTTEGLSPREGFRGTPKVLAPKPKPDR